MTNFKKLQMEIQQYDEEREKLIKKSRDVLKLSKQVIYAVHRGDKAEDLLKQMELEMKALNIIAEHSSRMLSEGSYKIAVQEFVEAILYSHFVKTGKLVDLDVPAEYFVLGLADVPGELTRKAVFLAGKGEVEKVVKIRDIVDMVYGELLKFDFRDNEIRRKVDAVKYELRKMEDLVLDLKLKAK